jgi:hypothetical protein
MKSFLLFLIAIIIISVNCSASVSREISFEMFEEDDIILIKSRTYSGNETSMVRSQLDSQFGNSDGYLDQTEVDAFVASYDNYLDQTNYIVMDEILVIKQNADVNYTNLVGLVSDNTSLITTTFTFDATLPHLIEENEHYIKFNRELWKYVDLDGTGRYTVDNNLTFSAPVNFTIVNSWGLLNITVSSGNKTLLANPDMQYDWVTVKISKGIFDDEPVEEDPEEEDNPMFLVMLITIPVIIVFMVLVIVLRRREHVPKKKSADGASSALSEEEIKDLEQEKKKIKDEILKVRSDLRKNVIPKNTAKSSESTLKGQFKEIQKKLDRDKNIREKQGK